jgi:hypothetical protein
MVRHSKVTTWTYRQAMSRDVFFSMVSYDLLKCIFHLHARHAGNFANIEIHCLHKELQNLNGLSFCYDKHKYPVLVSWLSNC